MDPNLDVTEGADDAQTPDTPPETLESDIRQFVIFLCGEEAFAVDMAPVQEIIRVPDVVRVPMSPPTLEGLANLRGKVLPIISLRRIFGFDERQSDDSSRAVVIDLGQPLGFVVDRVSSVVGVEPGRIEDVGALRSTVNTELLSGLLKNIGGHPMVMVLEFSKIVGNEFAQMSSLAGKNHGTKALSAGGTEGHADEDEALSDELQMVSFEAAEQEYAIPIESVQEIVQIPETIIHVPHSASHVLGVMTLRNRLLPLVSLRRMFGLPFQEADEHSRIVVVSLGIGAVGIVMDCVNEVLRVPKCAVDVMPKLLSREGDLSDISSICRLDGGKRLVSILCTDSLFRHSAIQEALENMSTLQQQESRRAQAEQEDDLDDEEQVVVFRLDKEEFGVPIESVQEIVRVPDELTHIPRAPSFVEGVINLRGSVLPVIDQRKRLGLPAIARSDRQRIMVFLLAGVRTGFIVDSVAEVLKIHKSLIEPSPSLSNEQAHLIARIANMEKQKRLIQLIEPAHLIGAEDEQALARLGA